MNQNTKKAVGAFAGILRAMGAPGAVIDEFLSDTEEVFGLPGQTVAPEVVKERLEQVRAKLQARIKEDTSGMPEHIRQLLLQSIQPGTQGEDQDESLKGMIQMGNRGDAEDLAELIKKTVPNAEVRVVDGWVLALDHMIHELRSLNYAPIYALESFKAAEEAVRIGLGGKKLTTEQQTLIDGLAAAGAKQEIIDELRAQFLGDK